MAMLKVKNAELYDVKMKSVQMREGGKISGHNTAWLVTFRVPYEAIDANELPRMKGFEVVINAESTQTELFAGDGDEEQTDDDADEEQAAESRGLSLPRRRNKRRAAGVV